jgi:hypothetical protein
MLKYLQFIFLFLFGIQALAGTKLPSPKETPNIFVISVGINKYPQPLPELRNGVRDSKAILDKLVKDNPRRSFNEVHHHNKVSPRLMVGSDIWHVVDSVHSYWLHDESATLDSIKSVFNEIASLAKPDDYFIFYFGGVSKELHSYDTHLIPFLGNQDSLAALSDSATLSVSVLAGLMEQIQCKNQLVISEAGDGQSFAQNLMAALFESNPLVAIGTDRNRIVLTTYSWGADDLNCKGFRAGHGPLVYYILNSGNLLNIFSNSRRYELNLNKAEIECPILESKYFDIYKERNYQNILISNYKKNQFRGGGVEDVEPKIDTTVTNEVKTFALVIATNIYDSKSGWSNLSNPINDADAISNLLENRYGVEIHKAYNKPKDSILAEIIRIKHLMDDNDKFIFFIAGHGHYSNDFTDGYLVLNNSRSLKSDFTLESYLQMATLNRMLDNMPSRNIFVIFDVCFGASFDLKAKDLNLNNYKDLDSDISVEEFVQRKSEYQSRIFIASGKNEVPDYWATDLDHSPFAAKLIKSLKKENKFISPGKIYSRMEGNATEPFLKQFGQQEPRGDFLLQVINR